VRLLLVNPRPKYEKDFTFSALIPSLALAVLGGAAKSAGHEVRVFDVWVEENPVESLRKLAGDFHPDFVGLTAYTPSYPCALEFARAVRDSSPAAKTILGGIHASVFPDEALETGLFDYVVVGEGDQTLLDILAAPTVRKIAGAKTRDAGLNSDVARPLIEDLDTLAFPAYEFFQLDWYFRRPAPLWKSSRMVRFETSRGCPYRCSFCAGNFIFRRQWRAKSPARVVAEIQHVMSFGFREIQFQDDNFAQDLERAKEICRLVLAQRLRFSWTLDNGIRVNTLDDEFLDLARKAGCYRIHYGVESGNQAVLDGVQKNTTLAQVRTAFEKTRRHGIETTALFIAGLPGETEETLRETRRFARALKADFAIMNLLSPIPGSDLYRQWRAEGRLVKENHELSSLHRIDRLLFVHPHLSEQTILAAYRRFYVSFYFRFSYFAQRVFRGLVRGSLLRDLKFFFRVFLRRLAALPAGRKPAPIVVTQSTNIGAPEP
jgi:radical SAM superfamily enzyme YgiQ (UPF0313 family)